MATDTVEPRAFQVEAVSYGRPAADLLARQVAGAKAGGALTPVTVVVPSNYAGVAMRRALAGRHGVAAVTFLTLHRLGELLGTARLAAAGRRPVSAAVIAAAVRNVLAAQPGVFGPVASHPATEEALAAAHRQLVGISPTALQALAGTSPRAGDVVRVHRGVRSALSTEWYDEHDLLLAAADAVQEGGRVAAGLGPVVVHLPQEIGLAAAQLLQRISHHTPVWVNVGLTGEDHADQQVRRGLTRLGLEADVLSPAAARVPRPVADRIVTTSDPDEEARAATRILVEAMRAGTPLARTAVLYASHEPYARLMGQHLEAAGIPWNGSQVRTVGQALLGRTLRALLALPDRRFRRDDVLAFLTSSPVVGLDGHPVPARAWDRISREAGVVDGDDWGRRLSLFSDESRQRAGAAQADGQEGKARYLRHEAERAGQLREFMDGIRQDLTDCHADGEPAWGWAQTARWATRLLHRYLGPQWRRGAWPEEERQAGDDVEAAVERLGGLDAVAGPPPSLEVFRRTLDAELDTSLRRVGRFGEGVLVGHISLAIGLELDLVVVLGLAEGTLPARRLDDSLLPDRERAATGAELRPRAELADDDHRYLLAAVAAGQQAVLCFPRGDLRRPGQRTASRWLLADAAALAGRQPVFTRHLPQLRHQPWMDEVPSHVGGIARLSEPAVEQEHNVRSLMALAGLLEDHPVVTGDPVIAAGVAMASARQSRAFTRFDGNLAGVCLPDLTADGTATSATRLQTWASCPHRYLLEYLLHVEVATDPERTHTMSHLDRGILVHEVLERFLTEAMDRDQPQGAWTNEQRARLRAIAEEVCDHYEARGLTGRSIFWRRDRTLILADLDKFLAEDDIRRAQLHTRPLAAELRFGFATSTTTASTGLARLALPDGRNIAFRGSADRVDRAADGTLVVIDYKTGKSKDCKGLGPVDPHQKGTKLQLPVYAAAARAAYGNRSTPVHAAYWFVTTKGGFDWIGYEVTPDIEAEVGRALAIVADGTAGGVFPAHPPAQRSYSGYVECPYCDPDGLGAGDRRRDWERKRHDPALASYLALAEPEEVDGDEA